MAQKEAFNSRPLGDAAVVVRIISPSKKSGGKLRSRSPRSPRPTEAKRRSWSGRISLGCSHIIMMDLDLRLLLVLLEDGVELLRILEIGHVDVIAVVHAGGRIEVVDGIVGGGTISGSILWGFLLYDLLLPDYARCQGERDG